ncbi:MAG: hypothetical protein IAG13_20990 [Deltaproteobacteria bacterium]|nr:hypothetical protein [Nannocystaceae bacterium]
MIQDWLSIVEAAYRIDVDEDSWLDGIMEASRPTLDEGFGAAALLYDASSLAAFDVRRLMLRWAPERMEPGRCLALFENPRLGPDTLAETFGKITYGLVSESFGRTFPAVLDACAAAGIQDMVAVNAIDGSLQGAFLVGHVPNRRRLSRHGRAMWTRVASHLASGYRLRRATGGAPEPPTVEAVLRPSGQLDHACGPAKEVEARHSLRASVKRLEQARGKMRRDEPEQAISAWSGLIDARWSLVDRFESDGRRYIVAHSNDSPTPPWKSLSPRERQVAAHVSLGHSDKHVAYELGLAPSTVRVLLMRAVRKLGVKSRAELTGLFRHEVRAGAAPAIERGPRGRPPRP